MDSKKIIIIALIAVVAVAVIAVALSGGESDDKTPQDPGTVDTYGDLKIYGNANNDLVVDDKDIKYIEDAIALKVPKTPFCDANKDGDVDEKDIEQVKKLIEREDGTVVWFIDAMGNDMTVEWPLNNIVVIGDTELMISIAIGLDDKTISAYTKVDPVFTKFLQNSKVLGKAGLQDHDIILQNGAPDAIVLSDSQYNKLDQPEITKIYKELGVDLISVNGMNAYKCASSTITYGFLMNKMAEAREYYDYHTTLFNEITKKVSTIPEDKKKTGLVWFGGHAAGGYDHPHTLTMVLAGGKPIADWTNWNKLNESENTWFYKYDPDFVFRIFSIGYDAEPQKGIDLYKKYEAMIAPMEVVKEKHLYVIDSTMPNVQQAAYYAELMYPDLFEQGYGDKWHQKLIDIYGLDIVSDGQFVVTFDEAHA